MKNKVRFPILELDFLDHGGSVDSYPSIYRFKCVGICVQETKTHYTIASWLSADKRTAADNGSVFGGTCIVKSVGLKVKRLGYVELPRKN